MLTMNPIGHAECPLAKAIVPMYQSEPCHWCGKDHQLMKPKVKVTIPNHKQLPGQVVASYEFNTLAEAEAYKQKVDSHPTGVYEGLIHY